MDIITSLLNLLLHIDKTMLEFIAQYGNWIYALLFVIIFAETGLVFAPFLPGDSLLFVAGAICAIGKMDPLLLIILLCVAAIAGDALNYAVGRWFGQTLISRTKLISAERLAYTQRFFDKHGGKTIVIARFLPIVRTMAPFAAGFGRMQSGKFFMFNVSGGLLWVISLTLAGYLFGNLPFIRNNLTLVIIAIIIISFIPGIVAYLRERAKG